MAELAKAARGSRLPGQFGVVDLLAAGMFEEVGIDFVGEAGLVLGWAEDHAHWGCAARRGGE